MVSTNDEIVNEVAPVEVQQQQQKADIKSISDEDFEKAQKLFQLGKKNLFLNKYDESVNNIGDACKTFASKFGEMDPQCAEVYFFYGRALLELARIENTVLGNALTGVPEENEPINDSRYGNPEEMTADEKNEISEKVIEALCSTEEEMKNGEQQAAKGETKCEEETKSVETTTTTTVTSVTVTDEKNGICVKETTTKVETTEKMETTAVETDDSTTAKPEKTATIEEDAAAGGELKKDNGESKEEGAAAATGEEEEEEDDEEETGEEETAEGANKEDADEDVSNLQSSWEMFELAKLIYTKNFDEDKLFKSKRIAECLLKLGEISIEQEIYEQAITDITESIRVQEEIECADRDERMLAESYYQLGLAKQFNNQMTEAKEAYQRSINIVQLRVEKLKGKLLELEAATTTTGGGEDVESEKTRINEEIGELEALTPEMTSKLEECNEPCAETLERIKEAKECFATSENGLKLAAGGASGTAAAANGNGDVKDITSLVKSKRKIENGAEEGCNGTTKKTKMNEESEEKHEEKECAPAAEDEEKMEDKSCEEKCETTGEKCEEKVAEDKCEVKVTEEEKTEKKCEEKAEEKMEEKCAEKAEEKIEEKCAEKTEEKMEEKCAEEKAEEKVEEKCAEKTEEKMEEKCAEEKAEEKCAEKTEEKMEEKCAEEKAEEKCAEKIEEPAALTETTNTTTGETCAEKIEIDENKENLETPKATGDECLTKMDEGKVEMTEAIGNEATETPAAATTEIAGGEPIATA